MSKNNFLIFFIFSIIFIGGCTYDHNIMIRDKNFYYDVTSFNNITPVTGSLSDINKCLDGNVMVVDEVTGSPALTINFTFTNVTYFNNIVFCHRYDGTHDLHQSIYNYNTSSFMYLNDVGNTDVINCNYKSIGGSSDDFINNGEVIIQIYHAQSGNPAHTENIDCLRLEV